MRGEEVDVRKDPWGKEGELRAVDDGALPSVGARGQELLSSPESLGT